MDFAPYTLLCDLRYLSVRQLVKSYHYASQFVSDYDAEFWLSQRAQVVIEIRRRISC